MFLRHSFQPALAPLILATVVLSACGSAQIERLSGEPTAIDPYTLPTARRTHPAVDGCQRFIAAVRKGDSASAWGQLSLDTRKALSVRAALAGLRGVDLLQQRILPQESGAPQPFDPLATFAVAEIKTLQLLTTPADEASVAQRLELTGADGGKRQVDMRFEGYAWRIHRPQL
jgi:hypothetical protein